MSTNDVIIAFFLLNCSICLWWAFKRSDSAIAWARKWGKPCVVRKPWERS